MYVKRRRRFRCDLQNIADCPSSLFPLWVAFLSFLFSFLSAPPKNGVAKEFSSSSFLLGGKCPSAHSLLLTGLAQKLDKTSSQFTQLFCCLHSAYKKNLFILTHKQFPLVHSENDFVPICEIPLQISAVRPGFLSFGITRLHLFLFPPLRSRVFITSSLGGDNFLSWTYRGWMHRNFS